MVSTIASDSDEPLLVGIGIGKRTTGAGAGELTVDRAKGLLSWWGPADGDHGRMAIAIRVDPAMIADIRADAGNHLVLLRVEPGRSEEHTSELQSLMRISYAVFCLKKKKNTITYHISNR